MLLRLKLSRPAIHTNTCSRSEAIPKISTCTCNANASASACRLTVCVLPSVAAVVGQSLVCWTSVCTTYICCVYHVYTLCVTCLLQSDSQFCMHNTFCVSFHQPTHSSLLSSAVLDRMYHTVCVMSGVHKV